MDITCYVMDGWAPRIRPASSRRDWMEATPERFAYRCLPLAIANAQGWELLSPCGFEARWNGGPLVEDVEIRIDEGSGTRVPVSLFGQGTLTFHVEGIFETPPGWNLWVGGSPNDAKDGIAPLGGVIETDWSPYTFTMNWRFTRANHWIRFEKDEPFCFFFPVERALFDRIEPRIRPLRDAPALRDAFLDWSRSRDDFQKWVEETRPTAPADRWQKLYYRGLKPDGHPGAADHMSKVRVPQFIGLDGAPLEAPLPPARCPASPGPAPAQPDERLETLGQLLDLLRDQHLTRNLATLRDIQRGAAPDAAAASSEPAGRALGHRQWALEIAERQRALADGADRIEETGRLTGDEFLQRFYAPSRPVVMRGAILDWPAIDRWTSQYLKDRIGAAEIELQGGRNGATDFELYKDNHKRTMAFDRFIDQIHDTASGNDLYITAYNSAANREAVAVLDSDLGTIESILTGQPGMLWIGPGGTFTPLHFDLTNNLLAQVVGTKHLVLLPPSETCKLAHNRHVFSDVHDITDPSFLALYPQAESARQFEVTLNPGDLLYIPVGWWHQVVAEDFSVMLTYTDFVWRNDAYEIFPANQGN
ncbi:DUF6065 family protein [Sphingomonas sp. HF-S3]|uniref:DUF6065 family protein n=1 Tax=Sphingomonas rustica TaxID=3103142 RepID=A0ABV0B6D3_9SPHN